VRLPVLYRRAEALLFFSGYEGFGMPVLEAMPQGRPMMCTSVTSLPEVAGEAALYVHSAQPSDWARTFLEMLPARRAELISIRQAAGGKVRPVSNKPALEGGVDPGRTSTLRSCLVLRGWNRSDGNLR
jgi:hypothetical protein